MKKISLFLLSILYPFIIFAAAGTGSISGKVLDTNQESLPFVNIAIFHSNAAKTPIKGDVSNESGDFLITGLPLGSYIVKVSYIGYVPIEKTITLSNQTPAVKSLQLILREDSKTLQEVQVIGQKGQMTMDMDKRVFNVDQSAIGAGSSASELLRNVPSVDVDVEGNVSLRNNSNVVVCINGKPSGLDEDNRGQILEQMPAESIEKIEIITNPSSKYSPEGTAGIINLVLKKDRKAGYFGSATAGVNTMGGFNVNSNFNYSSGKIDFYTNAGIRGRNMEGGGTTERTSWKEADTTLLSQNNKNSHNGMGAFLRAGTTWHIDKKNNLGLNLLGSWDERNMESSIDYNQTAPTGQILAWNRSTHSPTQVYSWSATLDYEHRFRENSDHLLSASLTYSGNNRPSVSEYKEHYTKYTDPIYAQDKLQQQNNNGQNQRVNIQIDYSNVLNKMFKIEAGYKGTLQQRFSSSKTYNDLQQQSPDTLYFNDFDYAEQVHALYATFSGKINKFSFQAGLRGEYTGRISSTTPYTLSAQGEPVAKAKESVPHDYFDLFPTLFLNYNLPQNNDLQLNLTRRINRPRGMMLNSFKRISDSKNISSGNPYLLPQYSWSAELNYIKRFTEHSLSASLYYKYEDGLFQQVQSMEQDIMYSTWENISQSQSVGMELMSKNRLFKVLDLTTTANLYYYSLDPFTYKELLYPSQSTLSWDIRLIANFMLPQEWGIQLNGFYRSAGIQAQGTRSDFFTVDAGVRKSFLNKTLVMSLSARDIFDSRRFTSTTYGKGFVQTASSFYSARMLQLTLSYNFGNMKSKRNKSERRDDSQDSDASMDFGGGEI